MSDRIKEQIGIYKEIFKSLFTLMIIVGGASFASLIHGKVTLWNILGAGLSIWLSISLVLLWRYMINLTEEIKNE
ncbi:hypothetical protein SAMN06265339_0706 [Desulfurobacterium pacificum]|uniref:Uncharacterized protein n=1 Tax=Desulfurobacterium pacificum TaxID=240166 RepID=A0ABY1NGN8_9BACT|nr:hypothetical protein SAMN06265339_0706 [Desulfurobacterium pacificum]